MPSYGDSPTFVQGLRSLGKWYVVDTSADARVWLSEPEVIPAGTKGPRGRATKQPRVATKPERVDEVVARLPAKAWKRMVVAEGSQGPRLYEYACVWVWFSDEGLPSGPERLLVRRSLGQHAEVKCQRSNAPAEVVLEKLAQVRGEHWSVEQSFQATKGEWSGATEEAIRVAEHEMVVTLPDDVRACYRIYDGQGCKNEERYPPGLLYGQHWQSLADILADWNVRKRLLDGGNYGHWRSASEDPIHTDWWHLS